MILVCSLVLALWAADTPIHPTIDFGWLRAVEQANGWLVVGSYQFSAEGEAILPDDVILAIDGQELSRCNAISAAAFLARIGHGAATIKLERNGRSRTIPLYPPQEPLLRTYARFQLMGKVPLYARNETAPAMTLSDVFGQKHTITYGPKLTLVHIWSTGCPACWKDVSALNEISMTIDPSLAVIALAMNDSPETIRVFEKQHEPLRFVNLLGGGWEDGEIAKRFGPLEIPTDVLIDPVGRVAFVGVGLDSLRSTLRAAKELSKR